MSLIIALILLIGLIFFLHFVFIAFKFAPFAPTPKIFIKKALTLANLKKGDTLIDLGCGTGRVLVIGAKEFGLQVEGYEISPILCLLAKINLFLHGVKGKVFCKNFLKEKIQKSDLFFLYLNPKLLEKVEKKLKEELKAGFKIVTFSSPLPSTKPKKILFLKRKPYLKVFLYEF